VNGGRRGLVGKLLRVMIRDELERGFLIERGLEDFRLGLGTVRLNLCYLVARFLAKMCLMRTSPLNRQCNMYGKRKLTCLM
jgi:hypothetical protein